MFLYYYNTNKLASEVNLIKGSIYERKYNIIVNNKYTFILLGYISNIAQESGFLLLVFNDRVHIYFIIIGIF